MHPLYTFYANESLHIPCIHKRVFVSCQHIRTMLLIVFAAHGPLSAWLQRFVESPIIDDATGQVLVPAGTHVLLFADDFSSVAGWPIFSTGHRACAGTQFARAYLPVLQRALVGHERFPRRPDTCGLGATTTPTWAQKRRCTLCALLYAPCSSVVNIKFQHEHTRAFLPTCALIGGNASGFACHHKSHGAGRAVVP